MMVPRLPFAIVWWCLVSNAASFATSRRRCAVVNGLDRTSVVIRRPSWPSSLLSLQASASNNNNNNDDPETSGTTTIVEFQAEEPPAAASTPPEEDDTTAISPRLAKSRQLAAAFCNLFPLWTVATAGIAIRSPQVFLKIPSSTFPAQIGLLMLCMGISLRPSDFQRVLSRPRAVALAFLGCYGLMPSLAFTIGKLFHLPTTYAAGLILVACINGAQASNLCTYIAKGDLALSVLMTTMTTIGAIVFTPLTSKLFLGTTVPVQAVKMAWSTIQVVLVPILLGMTINARFPKTVQNILPFSPILGVLITLALVGTSVAGCAGAIASAGLSLQLSVLALHGLGGLAGYLLTKPLYSETIARTFAIEFAMKSSAFGFLMAQLHFGAAYAVPSAVSIVWMTLIGSTMAVASRCFPAKKEDAEAAPAVAR